MFCMVEVQEIEEYIYSIQKIKFFLCQEDEEGDSEIPREVMREFQPLRGVGDFETNSLWMLVGQFTFPL